MDKQGYLSALLRNEDIHLLWSKLSVNIEDTDSSEELLTAIIQKWVTLRGFAQVSSWMEDYYGLLSREDISEIRKNGIL